MGMQTLVTAMTELPHGRRWTISPELNRVYVSADLPADEQWAAVAEAAAEMCACTAPARTALAS